MPAKLVPGPAIPELAERVTPEMLKVLRRIQREGFILNNNDIDQQHAAALLHLSELGLVDPGYEKTTDRVPNLWVSNWNGSRVLSYQTGIRSGPHYEITSNELAGWLEQQGAERWWNVDGDPLLTGRLPFPCPGDELATELRKINRPLLVQAKKEDTNAVGQPIDAEHLNDVVGLQTESTHFLASAQTPRWAKDRFLYLCWTDASDDWLLTEDSLTTEQMKRDEMSMATEMASVKKE